MKEQIESLNRRERYQQRNAAIAYDSFTVHDLSSDKCDNKNLACVRYVHNWDFGLTVRRSV